MHGTRGRTGAAAIIARARTVRLVRTGTAAAALLLAACGSGNTATTSPSSAPTDHLVSTSPSSSTTTSANPGAATGSAAATPTPTPAPLAAIVIEHPTSGETVRSPFHVTGTADVFEATFRVRLLDAQGRTLLDQPVMASSGTGTRGTFDATITTMARGAVTIDAYERSAKDSSPTHTVSVPITVG